MSFRNQEQHDAFKEWWKTYVKEYFPEQAKAVEDVESAMFVIKMAYSAGVRGMATRVQSSLSFETLSSTVIKEDNKTQDQP